MFKNYHLIITAIIVLVAWVILQHSFYLFVQSDINEYSQKYSTSQYILGEASPAKISDSELYVYASYAYWQGEDPTTINFEHPPLAKYYYGLFFTLFGNPYWGSIVLFFLILIVLDFLSQSIGLNILGRLVVLVTTGSLAIIQIHTRYVLLDLPQLFGTLVFFLGLINLNKKINIQWSLVVGIGLGIIAGGKYWFPVLPGFAGLTILSGIFQMKKKSGKKKKNLWMYYLIPLLLGAVIYLVSYTVYFASGHNLKDFMAFEWYRFNWFMGKTDAPLFQIFHTLFTGRFELHWNPGVYEITQHWSILWPISFVISVGTVAWILFTKQLKKYWELVLLLSYSYALLGIYSLGAAASDRFFIQLLPFWLLSVGFVVQKIWSMTESKAEALRKIN